MEDGGDKDMFADEGGENTGMEAKEVEESEDDETIDAIYTCYAAKVTKLFHEEIYTKIFYFYVFIFVMTGTDIIFSLNSLTGFNNRLLRQSS